MRHRKSINHLGRTASHRKAMISNMAASLIMHKRIQTTTAKAKALRTFVEPLITKSKEDSTHSRRVVFSYLQDKDAVTELFREISPKIADRPGGYTRILKTGTRLGDNADMCIIELVDYNENLLAAKEDAAATTGRRRRRGSKKKSDVETVAAVKTAVVTKEPEAIVEEQVEAISDAEIVEETASEVVAETVEEVKAEAKEEEGKKEEEQDETPDTEKKED